MPPTTYTVKQGDTLNAIAKQYGFSDYKAAGITSVPSGNFDLIRPGETITIPNYQTPVQQTTTQLRTTANENGGKLDQRLMTLTGQTQTEKAQPSTVSVVRDLDNGDGTRTVTYSDGKTARVQATKNTDGTESYKEMNAADGVNYDRDRNIDAAEDRSKQRVAEANAALDSISMLSNAATNALIQSVKKTYEAKMQLMGDTNKRMLGAKQQAGYRSGRAKYVSGVQQGILTDEEQKGIMRISELEGNMLTLIAQAEQARTDKDLEVFNKRMSMLDDADRSLQTEVQNLRKNAFDSLQEMRLSAQAQDELDQAEFDRMLDTSERSAPAVAEALKGFTSDDEKAAFIIQYADKQGIDPAVLMGDVEAALDDKAKAELDLVNIRNQITTRSQNAATSAYSASTSRKSLDTKLAGYGFETTPEQRAIVEGYIGKNLSNKDLEAARSNQTYFYTLLSEAEADIE